MLIHRAVFNRDLDLIKKLIEEGENVNEVEAAVGLYQSNRIPLTHSLNTPGFNP
jgi:hypothetical protein